MPIRQILLSVLSGPNLRDLLKGANTGQKHHFICRDEQGLSEFDLRITGAIKPDNDGTGRVVFAAQDTAGLLWALTYNPEEGTGDMIRSFGNGS